MLSSYLLSLLALLSLLLEHVLNTQQYKCGAIKLEEAENSQEKRKKTFFKLIPDKNPRQSVVFIIRLQSNQPNFAISERSVIKRKFDTIITYYGGGNS